MAVDLDRDDEFAHKEFGTSLHLSKRSEEAIPRLRTAINLNPNYSQALGQLGIVLIYLRKPDEGLKLVDKAMQLSPKDPLLPWYILHIGVHHFIEERYDEARVWSEKSLHENPNLPSGYRGLAAAHGMLGNLDEARAAYEKFDRLAPGMTIAACVQTVPFAYEDDANRFAEGLRRAGMPEE